MAKMRSPNYPATGLSEAVELVNQLWRKEGRTAVPPEVVARAWGYKSLSGLPRTKIGALKKYGLLDQSRDGLRLSPRAVQIVNYKSDTSEYQEAIQAAAKAPELFRELYVTHSTASDDALRAYLITKKSFSDAGARLAIKAFREALDVAKLEKSSYTPGDGNGAGSKLAVGDTVQWESQGALQFDKPRKITGFSDDETHAYVEGTSTGIPVQQLHKVEGPMSPVPPQVESMREPPKGVRREVIELDEGKAVLEWPAQVTADSLKDLKDWFNLVIRKAERSTKAEPKAD